MDAPEIDEQTDPNHPQQAGEQLTADFFGGMNSIMRMLLLGTHSKESPFSKLRGMKEVLKLIWGMVCDLWRHNIARDGIFASIVAHVAFPSPKNININMMPFIMGRAVSIPPEYRHYQAMIDQCPVELGEVGYLTIHESYVKPGESQRRSGLHTESPGC